MTDRDSGSLHDGISRRAMGYSVGDYTAPERVGNDYVIEYDEDAIRHLDSDF